MMFEYIITWLIFAFETFISNFYMSDWFLNNVWFYKIDK